MKPHWYKAALRYDRETRRNYRRFLDRHDLMSTHMIQFQTVQEAFFWLRWIEAEARKKARAY